MSEICKVAYTGLALPLLNTLYVLFSTVDAGMGAGMHQRNKAKKFTVVLKNDQAGTINLWAGTAATTVAAGWTQVSTTAVGIPAAGTSNPYEFLVESFEHFKVEFLCGGTTQTTFGIWMAFEDERAVS
jgi:hypothetical protein